MYRRISGKYKPLTLRKHLFGLSYLAALGLAEQPETCENMIQEISCQIKKTPKSGKERLT